VRGGGATSDDAAINGGAFFSRRLITAAGEVVLQGGDDDALREMLGEERYQQVKHTIERNMELRRSPQPLSEADAAVLRAAVAPLLHDLAVTGMGQPDIIEEARWYREYSVCGWISDLGGSGLGISVLRDGSPAEQIRELAGQIQDWATDRQVDPERPPVWPKCPEHGLAHGLFADVRDDTAVWVCPDGDRVVSAIGAL
jgi:hypothetical protein